MTIQQNAVHLRRSEVLAFGAALFHETGGISLGCYSPTLILNRRTGLNWSAEQWWSVIQPFFEELVNPSAHDPPLLDRAERSGFQPPAALLDSVRSAAGR